MSARCDTCGCTDEEGLSGTGSELLCVACVWSELLATRAERDTLLKAFGRIVDVSDATAPAPPTRKGTP